MSNSQNPATNKARKVIVGMSGGVDSSVSALLLQQQGANGGVDTAGHADDDFTGFIDSGILTIWHELEY